MKTALSILLLVNISFSQDTTLTIIPKPASFTLTGGSYRLSTTTQVVVQAPHLRAVAETFNEFLKSDFGFELPLHRGRKTPTQCVYLASDSRQPAEAYSLAVTDKRIDIAGGDAGVFYGLQTLRQLMHRRDSSSFDIPCVEIADTPRYTWRGMHLDVGRHFFPPAFIKRYIDFIAMYKMNTFHWHLTEDQGWRVEIKKYPKLTEVGAWRNGTMVGPYSDQKFDSVRYGGYYTQDEIRDIVAYAARRHVTIVPEIEMPGHSTAALASYPEFSCTGGPFSVGEGWGVYDDVYCTREETFTFLENVLTEICGLFPGRYIHIGGDECPKTRWKTCPRCQETVKREHLRNEDELQSYFISRIEKFLNAHGKQIIGWDEILEGGLAPNAAVMSWRGIEGGISAARQKHDVVMTPGSHCYFDYYQGDARYEPLAIGGYTPVEKVYSYEPTPDSLTPEEQRHILGAQGNVWTEYIPTTEEVEYMVFPRIAALAEVLWSPKNRRDYADFRRRLVRHFGLLDRMGINYSRAIYDVKTTVARAPSGDGIVCELSSPFDSTGIRYTTDGAVPTVNANQYRNPIPITKSSVLKVSFFEENKQRSATIEQAFVVTKSTGKNIVLQTPPNSGYFGSGAFSLVDGVRGDTSRHWLNWLGWQGPAMDATIDLGTKQPFSKVTIDIYDAEVSWIHRPRNVRIYLGDSPDTLSLVKQLSADEIRQSPKTIVMQLGPRNARYVRVVAEPAGTIPAGKPGAGNPAWLFVDEIMVE